MKVKYFVIGGLALFLYLAWQKKKREKEEAEIEKVLEDNAMPTQEQIDLIRLKLEDFLKANFRWSSIDEIRGWVIDITSNLEEYKKDLEKYSEDI
jgi:hypothetical protein